MVSSNDSTRWLSNELGLSTIYHTPTDVKLLCLQRFIRLFAYGASTLILVAFLTLLDISDAQTGLFMTLTLTGDVLISLFLTIIADQLGRRKILALGSVLMTASGIVFALSSNYYILLAAAILGVITPSGNEIGPFRAIEESTLAHLTLPEHRSTIFAWYALIGTAGSALGLITCGSTIKILKSHNYLPIDAYRTIFIGYAVVGLIKLILSLLLSTQCEIESSPETTPLLNKPKPLTLLPKVSKESRAILIELCILFAFDSFASGLAPLSWLTSYFHRRFSLPESTIGTLFFTTSIISAISILAAASIARRFGNIQTMVFTHLPSSICLALIGIPSQLPLAITFLIIRACTQSMDTGPRSAFLAAVVLPNERTTVMGTVNVVKTLSQSLGPLVTGLLAGKKLFWVAFLVAGSLKAVYDVGILLLFAGHKTREERSADVEEEEEEEDSQSERSG